MLLSIIVPCFNEEQVIETTHQRLVEAVQGFDFEIIYVNDGSRDRTRELLNAIRAKDARAKIVHLSRNFGHQIAVTAGLDRAGGDAVVIIDADMQDPPDLIPEMVAKWREGYEVVYGQRVERAGETAFKLATAKAFYWLLNEFSDVAIPQNVGDFRLIDRKVLEAIRAMPERHRFLRGMVSWTGFRQTPLCYSRAPRLAGETKYPLKKMISLASDALLSFSSVPLKSAIWLGMGAAVIAMIGFVYVVFLRLFTSEWAPGWSLLLTSIFFLGGVQLMFLGVVGSYVGRIFTEVKGRPLYLVASAEGFNRNDV